MQFLYGGIQNASSRLTVGIRETGYNNDFPCEGSGGLRAVHVSISKLNRIVRLLRKDRSVKIAFLNDNSSELPISICNSAKKRTFSWP